MIAGIARKCAFADPLTHFARRFRDAYGMTSRELRMLLASERPFDQC